MNKIKWIIVTLLASMGLAVAADNVPLSVTSQIGKTNSFTCIAQVQGYVDSIYVSGCAGPGTGTLVTVTSPKEMLLSVTCTNAGNYRIRAQDCGTNGVAISQYDRVMVFDQLTITASQSAGTNAVLAVLRIANALTP